MSDLVENPICWFYHAKAHILFGKGSWLTTFITKDSLLVNHMLLFVVLVISNVHISCGCLFMIVLVPSYCLLSIVMPYQLSSLTGCDGLVVENTPNSPWFDSYIRRVVSV